MLYLLAAISAALNVPSAYNWTLRDFVEQWGIYGFVVTPDSRLWINTSPAGGKDEWAILGSDLERWGGSEQPQVWIRGFHLRNRNVSYRESRLLVRIDCNADTIRIEHRFHYAADGTVLWHGSDFPIEPIVPGSVGEDWRNTACKPVNSDSSRFGQAAGPSLPG